MSIRTLIVVLGLVRLTACTQAPQRTVRITLPGAEGRTIYFDRFVNDRLQHVDSAVVDESGSATMVLPALPLDLYAITLDNAQHLVVATDSTEQLRIATTLEEFEVPTHVEGSAHTQAMVDFAAETRSYDERRQQLRQALVDSPGDTAALGQLNRASAAYYQLCKRVLETQAGSPVCLSVVRRLNLQEELATYKKVREDLRKPMARSAFYAMFRDQVDRAEQEEINRQMQERQLAQADNLLPLGSPAPEIRQRTPQGDMLALSDLRGKVVLVDFWASWCRPCRMENPNVKRVYERYHGKGFEILGVSLDRTKDAWTSAIAQDGLPWKHVSDLAFWNNAAAQEYGLSSIPYTVLVDPEGKIVGKNLRGPQLEAKLATMFPG
jgi:thiol-disulfide isomerase/thioredoxin